MSQEAITVAPPKGQTIAQVLRALKPFLPEGYTKLESERRASVGYSYGERLYIEVFGVCSWNASTQEKEGCHATSIRVTPGYAYRRTSRGPSAIGLRTTSHKPLKDGTFKLDTVGARLQFCLAQAKAMDEARAKEEAERKTEAEGAKAMTEEVRAYLERDGFNTAILDRYNEAPLLPRPPGGKDPEDEEMDDEDWARNKAVLRAKIRNNSKRIDLDLNGLTLDELIRVLAVLKPRVVRSKPLRVRRSR